MNFEWDELKARSNADKHSVTFEEAVTVFDDPLSLTIADTRHSEDEARFIALGRSIRQWLLVVAHTDRIDVIRIISARSNAP